MTNKKPDNEAASNHEHTYRATWHDYCAPAIYMLTMQTIERQPLLGRLNGEQISLTSIGSEVAEEIKRIPTYKDAQHIQIYRYVVMPDHIHVLLRVHQRLSHPIGYYISWFKLQCMERCSVPDGIPSGAKRPIFSPEYHDRVLTHEGLLEHIAAYIKANPHRLALKRANPELFRIRQQQRFGALTCTALGNIFLATHPQREVLQCSRRLTQAEIDAKREECLRAASNGTVYVSAAISEGEKQISRALRVAGFEMIILLTEGFPAPDSPSYKYFKPHGVYFEACAAGRLLLLEPTPEMFDSPEIEAAVYAKTGIHDLPHASQRYRFLALNAMAADLCRMTE